jgi:hypothetical protein
MEKNPVCMEKNPVKMEIFLHGYRMFGPLGEPAPALYGSRAGSSQLVVKVLAQGTGPNTILVASGLWPARGRGTTRDRAPAHVRTLGIVGKIGGSGLLTDRPHRAAWDSTTWPAWSSTTNSEPRRMLGPLEAPAPALYHLRAVAGSRVWLARGRNVGCCLNA